jgi:hypothetical protein
MLIGNQREIGRPLRQILAEVTDAERGETMRCEQRCQRTGREEPSLRATEQDHGRAGGTWRRRRKHADDVRTAVTLTPGAVTASIATARATTCPSASTTSVTSPARRLSPSHAAVGGAFYNVRTGSIDQNGWLGSARPGPKLVSGCVTFNATMPVASETNAVRL